jgi:DNA-binding transcriptional LysR family regulator
MRHLTVYRYIDRIARSGSIRSAAEYLAISPSALNRRILSFEDELGTMIFDRLATGVRLSTAGEILYRHILTQLADFAEVQSRIDDLSGLRSGHVSVAISTELAGAFVFDQIAHYMSEFPNVTFDQRICGPDDFETVLADFSVDIAIAFQPNQTEHYRTIAVSEQTVHCAVPIGSDLARQDTVRLYELIGMDVVMPAKGTALRRMLDVACRKRSVNLNAKLGLIGTGRDLDDAFPASVRFDVSLEPRSTFSPRGFRLIPLEPRDVPPGHISVGQLQARTLPVAPAKFAEQLVKNLSG